MTHAAASGGGAPLDLIHYLMGHVPRAGWLSKAVCMRQHSLLPASQLLVGCLIVASLLDSIWVVC
jgi:hypothetical protein